MTTLNQAPIATSTELSIFTVSLSTLKSLASMIHVAEPSKGATPALQQVKVTITAGSAIAVSTDRYVAVKADYGSVFSNQINTEFYITHETAKFINSLKSANKFSELAPIVSVCDGELIIDAGASVHKTRLSTLGYPNVATLIENAGAEPDAVSMRWNLANLAKLTKLVDQDGDKVTDWGLAPIYSSTNQNSAMMVAKAGPFTALIQSLRKN